MASDRTTDTIAALYPYDIATGSRTGAHPGKSFSAAGKTAYSTGAFFQAEDISFETVEELHAHLGRLGAEGKAFVVRSQRKPGLSKFVRRSANRRGKAPAGLQHAMLRCLPLDLDHVPNVEGFDPRVDPIGAWRWLVSLLGTEFQDVRVSAAWSSSCCVGVPQGQAPEHLDARLWVMLDTPIGAKKAKRLMQFFGIRVTAFFAAYGIRLEKASAKTGNVRPYHAVDWKISEVQQPIYVAAPRFLDGLLDPLQTRSALLDGKRDEVAYSDLQAAMRLEQPNCADDVVTPGIPFRETKTSAPKAKRTSRGRVRIPGRVVPMAASARLIAAQRATLDEAIRGTGTEAYRVACSHLYHRRVALEQVALVAHRGGLPEGTRDEGCTRIASAIVASLPLGWTIDRVRAEVRQLLALVVDEEWLDVEWIGAKADASIIDRYRRASNGETADHGRDLRYAYSKKRLVEEWQPTYAEITELGLRSLCSKADLSAADRDAERLAEGRQDREDWLAVARARAPEVHRLRSEGLSLRKIVAATGLPISKVQRLLALSDADVAELEQVMAPVVAAVAEVVVVAEAVAADPLVTAIRYVMLSTGADTPGEVANILREPVGMVEHVMMEMGMWRLPEQGMLLAA